MTRKGRVQLYILRWLLFFCLVSIVSPPFALTVTEKKNVLFISSYHPAFPTFFDQAAGIRKAFSHSQYEIALDIECMDSKRFPDKESLHTFTALLTHKLSRLPPYDLILVGDDNALAFALQEQDQLFAHKPIIFFGINNQTLALEQNNNAQVTGVIEAISMHETIALMHDLHPDATQLFALVDGTNSGQADAQNFLSIQNDFPALSPDLLRLDTLSWQELGQTLQELPADALVLLLSAYKDMHATHKTFRESLEFITQHLSVPLYHLWYHGIGEGIVGGKVISQYEQARTAAMMAIDIFKGRDPATIPVLDESPNRYIFDYVQIQRFNIAISKLPEGTTLLNQPYSFYQQNRLLILVAGGAFSILLLALFSTIINILRQKRLEQKLRASEEQYRNLIEGTRDAIISADAQGYIRSWNTGAVKMFGYRREEIQGHSIALLTPPHLQAEQHQTFEQMMSVGSKHGYQTFRQGKDGKSIPVEMSLSCRKDMAGNPLETIAFVRDISERYAAENALKASEIKFSKIFHSAPFIMTLSALEDGAYIDVNDAFVEVTGFTREMITDESSVSIGFLTIENRKKILEELAHKGSIHNLELEVKKANGSIFPCLFSIEQIEINGKKTLLSIGSDISKRKQLEQNLLQAQKMEAIGTLAGGIAHDFNNILTAIMGYTEIAQEKCSSSSDIADDLDKVISSAQRAQDLVYQILAFSRQSNTEYIPIQPAVLVKEALKMLRPSLPTTITIESHIDTITGTVHINPTQLNQVIINLCTNAFHAMEKHGGTLTVSCRPAQLEMGLYAHISVQDTGCGIPAEIQERIFEPYFTTKEEGKGTGMGLAIIHGIIKDCHGFIKVTSEVNKGTSVHVFLPIMDVQQQPILSPTPNKQDRPSQEDEIQGGQEKILYIDDEENIANLAKIMLQRLGYQVHVQYSSAEALALFKENPSAFDLIITDQTMPEYTGTELAEQVLQIRPDMPIILCTGYSSITSEADAKQVGIREFLFKPLSKKDLASSVRKALNSEVS